MRAIRKQTAGSYFKHTSTPSVNVPSLGVGSVRYQYSGGSKCGHFWDLQGVLNLGVKIKLKRPEHTVEPPTKDLPRKGQYSHNDNIPIVIASEKRKPSNLQWTL